MSLRSFSDSTYTTRLQQPTCIPSVPIYREMSLVKTPLLSLSLKNLQTRLFLVLTSRCSALSYSEVNSLSFSISLGLFLFSLLSPKDNTPPLGSAASWETESLLHLRFPLLPVIYNSILWQTFDKSLAFTKCQPVSSEPSSPHSKASTLAYKDVNKHKSSLRTV